MENKPKRVEARCIHGRIIRFCFPCGGKCMCEHGRKRSQCVECPIRENPSVDICKVCHSTSLRGRRRQIGNCKGCDKLVEQQRLRIEITFGNMIINAVGYEPNVKDKTMATSQMCGDLEKRRPDLLWVIPNKVAVVVEIDEDSHVSRESSCEVRKISEQNLAIQDSPDCQNIPVLTFRVNPDAYDKDDVSLEDRAKIVGNLVKNILHGDYELETNAYQKIFFCFYHSKSQKHIDEHMKWWTCEIVD